LELGLYTLCTSIYLVFDFPGKLLHRFLKIDSKIVPKRVKNTSDEKNNEDLN